MKVAIVHYWLLSMRGGEKVLEALSELYPDADIFTLVYNPDAISGRLKNHKITTSFLQKIPGSKKYYQMLLPIMPLALESMNLTEYDLVISSESGPAKGIIPKPDAVHVCYCHSPMRYIWDHYFFYHSSAGFVKKLFMPFIASWLRQWDVSTSARVDCFVANSRHIANRVQKYYRRDAVVIHPPVSVDDFAISDTTEDFYLCAGQLVGYKRVDLAVDAFTAMNKNLVVIGTGEEMEKLKSRAGPTIRFLDHQPFASLKSHMARCKALIFPGEEDFGIVPVEVMASGRPVIAFGRGGAVDTVIDGLSGVLFFEQTVDSLTESVKRFEAMADSFSPAAIRAHSLRFSKDNFKKKIAALVRKEFERRAVQATVDQIEANAPAVGETWVRTNGLVLSMKTKPQANSNVMRPIL
ncbi:glycosyl transferase [Phyllobacterium brassicacearum]|uniref:Glycosyl transferase n=1 Tax=Phyllobacterium brassicacearum TaxID=314235 RepID=A0A2P7BWV7_9HYPH|nr:glycosyltransferase family 4 protein [Phyllobacterium brassicacearum]PSH70950.1 glycosyl transferase [Phyllobacterium brassicacearum]TDQ35547.1 glycosyltransferase involved in cell wall biosynthesis [Phyllobacterium brassicacearum]